MSRLYSVLMEGDIVFLNDNNKGRYLYPSDKRKFIAHVEGYKIEYKYKDIVKFEHFERHPREILEYMT